ncbi:uncharacterized protein BP5553_00380 [Venustampulla echinocandica]|uniref:LysM domain-containing protein n=1 Tax=Venustampulla echinocandica TaxID=2656787 RepID=A0A370TY09_9HELO|nr:uncharacterized protein BP5553_00380 [Venustampulla echinocandica]RDL40401.1 hypothetical protein BP5553_00380 [Venustampulla echinocandica]
MSESCGSCAILLRNIPPPYDEPGLDPQSPDRRLYCCGPFCQISSEPSCLPQGLRDPPSYTPFSSSSSHKQDAASDPKDLPAYSPSEVPHTSDVKAPVEDIAHFLDHDVDTLTSVALRYNVPISALRRANNITSDHLLLARRTITIPSEFYKGGVSLSPRPIEGEEEETRKAIVRRWMVACKVSEYVLPLAAFVGGDMPSLGKEGKLTWGFGMPCSYDAAVSYLKLADYDLDMAILSFKDDERWEKEHPMEGSMKVREKMKHVLGRRVFTGQR